MHKYEKKTRENRNRHTQSFFFSSIILMMKKKQND